MKYLFFLLFSFPSSFSCFPFDVEITRPIYSAIGQNIQGITQNESYWYISNQFEIYQIPRTTDLVEKNFYPPAILNYKKIGIPRKLQDLGYNHFGGISVYQNYIIVALERVSPMKILFFDHVSLELKYEFDVPKKLKSLSWVAGSSSGIYFSENLINEQHPLYFLEFNSKKLTEIKVRDQISSIQGGSYNERTQTLIFSADMGSRVGGVYEFDFKTKSFKQEVAIRYNPGFPAYQELEGLCAYQENGSDKISLLLLDNDYVQDGFHFIHITDYHFRSNVEVEMSSP